MKNKKKKFNEKRFILIVFLIVAVIYCYIQFIVNSTNAPIMSSNNSLSSPKTSKYDVIKAENNLNYSGDGQKKTESKDGYFTTFTTVDENKKTYIEYKQGGNSSWSQNSYWGGTMEENGCGITVMSIILSGYGKNYTPENLRKKYQPVLNYDLLSSELKNSYGINNSDFFYDSVHLSNNQILNHLKTNRPIIACLWNKPTNNRWTTSSHYIALLACDDYNTVYVSNPNGGENDAKSSGWYNINDVSPYIAKILYIESYK